jgi:hypothetical protein
MTSFTRRTLLGGGAAAVLAPNLPQTAEAAAPLAGKQAPGWYRYKVGSFEVTVATDGITRFKFRTDSSPTRAERR